MNPADDLAGAAGHLSMSDKEDGKEHDDGLAKLPPITSTIVGDKKLWDITARFRSLASELPIGTLVKDDQFTLFESVGALEIMDPKMDSGFLAPGESLVDDYDIFRELLPEEVVGIMDQLLCSEMAWHEGYPLAQTLFTSHYIDALLSSTNETVDQIQFDRTLRDFRGSSPARAGGALLHIVLRAYCMALIKCCDYTLDEINRSLEHGGTSVNFYEEEDFSGHTYGRELLTSIPKEGIISALSDAIDWVDVESGQGSVAAEVHSVYDAIRDRLEFRLSLLLAMATDEPVSSLADSWVDVSNRLNLQYQSHKLGKAVPESMSAKIQRRLASTVPPKPIVEVSYEDAFKTLAQMCADCQEAIRIVDFGAEHVQRLKLFLWSFSSRKPEPLSYPRACLSAPLFSCDDRGFEQFLRRDVEEILLPQDPILDPVNWTFEAPQSNSVAPDPRFEIASAIDRFTESSVRMIGGYIDFYRALCSNRCRLRRNLCHVVVALEEHQTRETEQLDGVLQELSPESPPFPISTWTYYQKLQAMMWIVQLGFELDIYLPDELAGMYWYLNLLATSLASVVELNLTTLQTRQARQTRRKNSSKSGTPSKPHVTREIASTIEYLESTLHFINGTRHLSEALFSLYTYLSYTNHIPAPATKSSFYSPKKRYELRMKPFLTVTGAAVPAFEEFDEAIRPWGPFEKPDVPFEKVSRGFFVGVDAMIKDARVCFSTVKQMGSEAAMCEGVEGWWGKNISSILASCVAAGIAVATLRTAMENHSVRTLKLTCPEPGKRYHDWWIVPKFS